MRIKRICYPVRVLGPGERVGIWVTGCRFHCEGCMSPELQSFCAGREIPCEKIVAHIKRDAPQADGFTISGGEPFEQPEELAKLVRAIRAGFCDDIIIYTGYTIAELKQMKNESVDYILGNIAVLVDGRYQESQNSGTGLRGSDNQCIHIFYNREKYEYMKDCRRTVQVFNYKDANSLIVGLM